MTRVADYIVERLYAETVKHIFMVTGRGSLFLSDAVARHQDTTGISVHHEQAAAYAAVAYAQYNDRLGACLVSTGCAGTNAITATLSAWQDGVPCVFVSGQNMLQETSRHTGIPIRTFGQQEADIVSIVEPITKYATMITDPAQIAYQMDKALHMAQTGRKGPVWIDVPLDLQSMRVEPDALHRLETDGDNTCDPDPEDLAYVQHCLNEARRPVLLIGNGIRSSGATEILEEFVARHPLPIVFSGSAPDVYGSDKRLSTGSVGIMGCSRAGNFALQNADLLLVIGNRLSPMTTGSDYCKFARAAKTVVVDIDPAEHAKNTVRIDKLITSDAGRFLRGLRELGVTPASSEWIEKCAHWKDIFPKCDEKQRASDAIDLHYLAEALSDTLPENAVFVSDSGLAELILPTNIDFRKGQRCIHPASQGAMGYALPAAIGAYFSSGNPIIAVIGDGSIMMNLQELETIRYHRVPIKIIVVNNNAYAVIRKRQVELFRKRTIGTDPSNGVSCPDFEKLSATFDIAYMRINDSSQLPVKLKELLAMDGPAICELRGLESQGYVSIDHARTGDGKFARRPLEDQSPFLDRETFLSEMVIEPIDQ